MNKKIIVIILFLLTGCQNKRVVACEYSGKDTDININISAINDDIVSFEATKSIIIPNSVMANEEYYNFLISQLDNTYHFEGNTLIKEDIYELDDIYSLQLTKDYLKKLRFYCE